MYDLTDTESFDRMNQWVTELRRYLINDTPILIAGNKCDLPNRVISEEQAEEYARTMNTQHHLTSAKAGTNVKEIFESLATQILQRQEQTTIELPKKINQRGLIKVGGVDSFDPRMSLKLTEKKHS